MEVIKKVFYRLDRWEYTWLCFLVALMLVMHLLIITKADQVMFDEVYYVSDARSIIAGEGSQRPEHPSLGKLIIASGVLLFGDNPVGWRSMPVLFGTTGIVFFYLICRRLSMSRRTSCLATFLLALENMTFVQASVAMLDVFTVTFMLVCFWFYLRGNYPFAGIVAGLAALTKLNGLLIAIALPIHWLIKRRDKKWRFGAGMLLVPLSFIEFMPLIDYLVYGYLTDPIKRLETMMSLTSSLTFASITPRPDATRPWFWILTPQVMPFWYVPHYMSAVSFNVWAVMIPVIIYMLYRVIKHKDDAGLFALSWFTATYLTWIPLTLITDRVSFVYYFYPTVGAVIIGVGLGLSRLIDIWKERRPGKISRASIAFVIFFLVLHVVIFVIISPLSPIPWYSLPLIRT